MLETAFRLGTVRPVDALLALCRRRFEGGELCISGAQFAATPRVRKRRPHTKQTSNEARGPGEFKHIINRRKRN